MRLVISIRPSDLDFSTNKASLCRCLKAFKDSATREKQKPQTRAHPSLEVLLVLVSIMLVEVGPVEVTEIMRVGLLG
jgi:hypothetical protein